MANIVVTEKCNLKCPYCFASEVMTQKNKDITMNQFNRIVEFITRTDDHFGIIGGEPLVHKEIDDIFRCAISNKKIKHVTLFTNGVYIDEHIKLLTHPKISILINVNSEEDMGTVMYSRMRNNLEMMFNDYMMGYKLTLGINIYRPDQNLNPFINIAKRYGVHNVRASISVPKNKNIDFREYFKKFIPLVKSFLTTMNRLDITVSFDCNLIPVCLIDHSLEKLMIASERIGNGRHYVSTNKCSKCNTVIDIDSDGIAIRCFGMSDGPRYNIFDFHDLPEINATMIYDIDIKALDLAEGECKTCEYTKCQKCYGGCIAFRMSKNSNDSSA